MNFYDLLDMLLAAIGLAIILAISLFTFGLVLWLLISAFIATSNWMQNLLF